MMVEKPIYTVAKRTEFLRIDSQWDKANWQKIEAVRLENYMGKKPVFFPDVRAKMMYDHVSLYVIFHVKDKYVRCITDSINGKVWEDSCVEFFFAPDIHFPNRYFNLEINCGGTSLMHYNFSSDKKIFIPADDIKSIKIAHSLPKIIDPEIKKEISWTLEYRLPLKLLEKYSAISYPDKERIWRVNFYKISENSSNPHYLTWSYVNNPEPDFHLPDNFGFLKFQ